MRTSKIEKEINQIIVDNNEVNESVLNEVKSEMLKDKLHKTSTFRLSFPIKYVRMMKVAIIIVFTILLPVTGVGTYFAVNYGWYGDKDITYQYDNLKKLKIKSIEWYNQTYNTNYQWLKKLPVIDTYSLSNWKNEIVMLEEQYQYQNHLVTLCVCAENESIKFNGFSNRHQDEFINDVTIHCAYDNSMQTMVKFSLIDTVYYLIFDYEVTNVKDTLIELFKNQSIFD